MIDHRDFLQIGNLRLNNVADTLVQYSIVGTNYHHLKIYGLTLHGQHENTTSE